MFSITAKKVLVTAVFVAIVGAMVWLQFKPVPGVETMSAGDNDPVIAMIGLASSVVGLLTSVVTLFVTLSKRRE